jgi:hypothetical protein
VTFTCQKLTLNQEENYTSTVCNKQGKWDPDPAEFCAITLGKLPPLIVIIIVVYIYSTHEL